MEQPMLKPSSWVAKKLDCKQLPADWQEWVLAQAQGLGECWMLAFALEGVVWGKIENGVLRLAASSFPGKVLAPESSTLQELFVFSPRGQAHAWIDSEKWKASLLTDSAMPGDNFIDQDLILWGTDMKETDWQEGFALLVEGAQGMTHAVPLKAKPVLAQDRKGSPRLSVRNYIGQDPRNGVAFIAATRFVAIKG